MIFTDRVKDVTTSTGTDAFTLSGTPPAGGYQPISAIGAIGTTFIYGASSGNLWEIGVGTITAANTVSRAPTSSSSGGALVSLPAGADFFCTVSAAQISAFLTLADGVTTVALPAAGALSGSDIVVVNQGGVDVQTTLTAIAAAVAAINGGGDVTAPTASSAAVANATPTVVAITMSEAMSGSYVPAASAFTVSGHTVSSVAISGSTISLTCSASFVNGEAARTVAYTQPGTNNVRDTAGNLLANFTALAITNNVAATDTTAPTFASAQVADAAPTLIVITMSETLAAFTPAAAAFAVSGGKTVSSVARSGATITLTCSAAYVNGDTITVTYTKPGTNMLQDAAGNQTASFGPSAVTNNVAAAGTSYTLTRNSNGAAATTTPGTPITRASTNSGTFANSGTSVNYIAFSPTVGISAEQYWGVSPVPAKVYMGWGTSSTVAPTQVADATSATADAVKVDAGTLQLATGSGTFTNGQYFLMNSQYMWVRDTPGTANWYFWIKPVDGVAVCVNASSPCVVTLS